MVSITDIDTTSTPDGLLDNSPTSSSLVEDVRHAIQHVVFISGPYRFTNLSIGRFELTYAFGDTSVSVKGAEVAESKDANVYHSNHKKERFLFPAEDWGQAFLEDADAWFEEQRTRVTRVLLAKKK